jgi:DNA (cytosine-5)-methyltransferase 1
MLNHLELFAGIGGFRQAIELLGKDFSIKNNCVGFSEIDSYATKTYKANFKIENEVEIGDIVKFTSHKKNIEALNDFSILTGGFPCQSFSMMGQQRGFEDKRGDVFYRITDILKIKEPPFVLLENVKNRLLSFNFYTI